MLTTIAERRRISSMDTPTEALPDRRIRVEIRKLMAQTVRLSAEQSRFNAKQASLYTEATKSLVDRAWYPPVAIAIAAGTGGTVVYVMHKLFGG